MGTSPGSSSKRRGWTSREVLLTPHGFEEAADRLSTRGSRLPAAQRAAPGWPSRKTWANSPPPPPLQEHRQGRGEQHPFPIPMCLDPACCQHFFSVCQCEPALLPPPISPLGSEGRGSPARPPQAGGRTGDPNMGTWVTLPGPLGMARDSPPPNQGQKSQPQTSPHPAAQQA